MSRRLAALLLLACCAALALGACGRSEEDVPFIEEPDVQAPNTPPKESDDGEESSPARPAVTKNTTRLLGPDAASLAADAALAVFPSTSRENRPGAVALVDQRDWRTTLAAASLMGGELRAPMLLTGPDELPTVTAEALALMAPAGSEQARGAQVIRVGAVPQPEGLRPTDITASGPAATAAAIDSFLTSTRGQASRRVVVVGADDPAFAMPAAGWAAKSGDPILFVGRDTVPPETVAALRGRNNPQIYLLGPESAVSAQVEAQLDRLGSVRRIEGADPVANAIAFARYSRGTFGWGVTDPGHGLVFARSDAPTAAGAVAPLSAAGSYGPLLLLDGPGAIPAPLREYLLDIQPGYREDPVRGVYNHGWIAGDDDAISPAAQAEIDGLLEIVPVQRTTQTTTTATTPTQTTPPTTTTTTATTTP